MSGNRELVELFIASLEARDWDNWAALLHPAVVYEIPLPPPALDEPQRGGRSLYIHAPRGRRGRNIDAATERFVEETRMGTAP